MEEQVSVEISKYEVQDGVSEYHGIIRITCPSMPYAEQVKSVMTAYRHLLEEKLPGSVAVFKRFFLSDAANQAAYLSDFPGATSDCATSIIEQPPLDGTKIALWVYLLKGVSKTKPLTDNLFEVRHSAYRHLWTANCSHPHDDSREQTLFLLNDYTSKLEEEGCRLADDCIRTWFFVQNVDVNYSGVVRARNEVFATQGLTPQTHFIASTGIAGRQANSKAFVQMDAYAIQGLQKGQIHHLYARTHLNPTYEYGVSFERGTMIDYGDRRHVFISGTASINNKGEIMYPGDIRRQTQRMWENVEALLKEAECGYEHVGHLIVYLRDMADYTVVKEMFAKRFPHIPQVFLLAPVCRPGWLVEMECMAVKPICNDSYPSF